MPLNIPKVFVETPSGTIPPPHLYPPGPLLVSMPECPWWRVIGWNWSRTLQTSPLMAPTTFHWRSQGVHPGVVRPRFLKVVCRAADCPPAPPPRIWLHTTTPEGDNLPKSDWRCISDTTQFMWRLSRIFELWKSFNISPPPYHLSELTEAASSKLDTTKPKKCKSGENAITKWLSFKNLIDLSIRIH